MEHVPILPARDVERSHGAVLRRGRSKQRSATRSDDALLGFNLITCEIDPRCSIFVHPTDIGINDHDILLNLGIRTFYQWTCFVNCGDLKD